MGLVSLDQMPRLAAAVEGAQPLEITLQYGKDPDGVYIQSSVQGKCELLCQFCLSVHPFQIESHTRFRPVLTLEATREIPDEDDPVLYENGFINVINMIEDDALLALPNYPKCADCSNEDTFSVQFATISDLDLHESK